LSPLVHCASLTSALPRLFCAEAQYWGSSAAVFEKEEEGGSHVFCPLPGCHTQSDSIEEGIDNIREAGELYRQSTYRKSAT